MANLNIFKNQFFDANGVPLSGGKVYTYSAGTTTPKSTYTDSTGVTPNTNPVILNSRGEASIWLSGNYKIILKDSLDNQIWSVDNVAQLNDASNITFTPSGTGAVATTVQGKLMESVSVNDFGAVGDGVADDTAAIQAAINYGITSGMSVYIKSGTYKFSTLTITGRINIFGDGMFTSILNSTCTGSTDAITITPPTNGSSNTGYLFSDFGVTNAILGAGRYGIRITLGTNAYLSNSEFARIYIGTFGNQGLYLDNTIGNQNGFFTTTIRRSWITNGILGVSVGDSINIEENTITSNAGYIYTGINLTSLVGARQIVINSNNITTLGGAIYLSGVYGSTIENNQLEYILSTNYSGSQIGFVQLNNCLHSVIEKNTISPNAGSASIPVTNAISLTGTTKRTYIRNNELNVGYTNHIQSDNTTDMTFIYPDNRYNTVNPVFSLLGTDTRGIWLTPTLLNNWVNTGGSSGNVQYYKNIDGNVMLSGSLSAGTSTMFTLPSAFCPASNVRFLTVYDGSSTPVVLQITNSGGGGGVIAISSPGNVGVHLEGSTWKAQFTN